MKITRITTEAHSERRANPVRDALQALDTHGACRVTVETSEGVTGHGSVGFGRLDAGPALVAQMIETELAPAVIGRDPFMVRAIRDELWKLTDYHGSTGLACFAIAGIDIALWDVMGRAVGKPVWRLLGGARERVPAYAMVGWLNYSLDELKRVCEQAMRQGFAGVKIKVGAPTLDEDVARIEATRAAIGPRAHLMVDANQVFTLSEALRRGHVYEQLGCYWFEEPLRADDHAGLAELSHALAIPVASGENDFGRRQFRDLFERRAVDVVQPDLRRAGGLTECFDVGLMAAAFDVAYASHGGGPHLHVLAALPNTLFMESGLSIDGRPVEPEDGCILLPETPGL